MRIPYAKRRKTREQNRAYALNRTGAVPAATMDGQQRTISICKGKFAFEEMRGDHIKPWSKGGRTVPENLQMLCADCNARKSDKF